MKRYNILFILYSVVLSNLLWTSLSWSYDLGTLGQTYPIKEIDIKLVIAKQGEHLPLDKIKAELKDSTQSYFKNLPNFGLTPVEQTQTRYVDPSVAYNKDYAYKGRVFYRKGTFVNPLSVVRPSTVMLYFDGNDDEQLQFAKDVIKNHPMRVQLVLTNGNPQALGKVLQRPVGYANKQILARFHIQHVPSLLGVGKDAHYLDLAITDFAFPYSTKLFDLCWNGCSQSLINKFNRNEAVSSKTKEKGEVNHA